MSKPLAKQKLKNIDDLFQLDGTEGRATVHELNLDELVPFAAHPFHLYDGERLDDMVESVKANGVLVPILVRRTPDTRKYEILAGHNRENASRIAQKTTIPAIVLENISDEEALAIVIETNLMQRSFADMKHSEKAAVIAMHHAKMFSPGKRHDILRILEQMQDPTLPQVGEKSDEEISHTDKKIAEMYSLSKNTVSRYLRIHQLYTPLKEMLDIGFVPFIPAVTVSFLTDSEQIMLADYLDEGIGRLDIKKADLLREYSKEGKLDRQSMVAILSGKAVPKPQKAPTIKVSGEVYSRYFTSGQSAQEVQTVVEDALAFYFHHKATGTEG
jgi:ParB family chromosome partitioning protein